MTINTKSMFDAIRQSLSTEKESGNSGGGLFKEILKFSVGNTYTVRLVPNPNSPKDSIFKYFHHSWNSNSTGKFISALCPTTFGDTCPIDAYYLKTYRSGTESEKQASKILSRKESWMVNAYVVSDPVNPENEGKVKILRYGSELGKIIESALTGDDSEEFGIERVFDVVNGCTLRIKCENRSEKKGRTSTSKMVTYASSKFLAPSTLDNVDINSVYESVHDLKSVYKINTTADMQRLLDEHFFNLNTGSRAPEDSSSEELFSDKREATSETFSEKNSVNETDESTDETLRKLLEDL
jgi:hypothetical protein